MGTLPERTMTRDEYQRKMSACREALRDDMYPYTHELIEHVHECKQWLAFKALPERYHYKPVSDGYCEYQDMRVADYVAALWEKEIEDMAERFHAGNSY